MEYPPTIIVGLDDAEGHMFTLRENIAGKDRDVIPNESFYSYLEDKSSINDMENLKEKIDVFRKFYDNREELLDEYISAGQAVVAAFMKCLPDSTVLFQSCSAHDAT